MKTGAPLLLPVISLISGVILAEYGIGLTAGITLIAVAIIIYMLLLRLSRSPMRGMKLNRYHYVWVILMFAGTGVSVKWISSPEDIGDDVFYHIRGRVTERASSTNGDRLTVYLREIKPCDETGEPYGEWKKIHNTSVRIYLDPTLIKHGDIIEACGEIKKVRERHDKLHDNFALTMQRKGIPYTMTLYSPQKISMTGHRETIMSFA